MNFHTARVAPEKAVFRPALPMCFQPGISEMQMATMTFKEQYLHPQWQRKRLEVMSAAGYACENCGETEATLNVHHKRYVKGRMVWDYERDELACLCEPCHKTHHKERALLDAILASSGIPIAVVIGLVAGYLEGDLGLDDDLLKQATEIGGIDFELGVMASIWSGRMPSELHVAFDSMAKKPKHLTPPQEAAIERWRQFAENLEASGL